MKRALLFTLGFLASTAVIYLIMVLVSASFNLRGNTLLDWSNNYFVPKGGSTYLRFDEFNKNTGRKYDLIFLGSSRTYRGYDPIIFRDHGYDTYNLGSYNQTLSNSYVLAKHMLDSLNTQNLIVDLYPLALSDISLESSLDLSRIFQMMS